MKPTKTTGTLILAKEPRPVASVNCRKIAREVAAALFTNGAGETAQTLKLELLDGTFGGGWCIQAVATTVEEKLRAALSH